MRNISDPLFFLIFTISQDSSKMVNNKVIDNLRYEEK
ncbi:hypothetical protein ViNHUV68_21390 [Vibrio sp. NH-UV-68]